MSLGVDLVLAGFAAGLLVLLATIDTAYGLISDVSLHILRGGRSERRVAFFNELMEHQERFRMALQLGIQVATIALAALAVHVLQQLGVPYPTLAGFLAALAIVILGRLLLPRLVAQNTPERVLMGLLPIFRPFYRLASLVVVPLSTLYRTFHREAPAETENEDAGLDETMSDIQALIDVAEEEGIIEGAEGALIQSIVELAETHVHEVMTPRTNIVAVSNEATILEARDLMIATRHSRLPVYADQIDNVEGVLHVRDVLAAWAAGQERETVPSVMRPAYFVPEVKPVGDLLEEMRKSQVQIAMVIDEYGAVGGLITIEDLLEEIVGEIEDEDVSVAEEDEMVAQDDGAVVVKGSTEIRKVELQFDTELEADDFTTVAGLIINELGHLPSRGERLEFRGFEFEVLEADNRRVNLVRLRPLEPDQPQEAAPQR
jgi:CBS domain containing-hemolysin-like protein